MALTHRLARAARARDDLWGLVERGWVLLEESDQYEAWGIGWPPGSHIDLHDHGDSRGVVAVAAGVLTETVVRIGRRGTVVIGTECVGAGQHRRFGPAHVHLLSNDSDRGAISVHVYQPRLSTMRYYQIDRHGRLVVVRSDPVASTVDRSSASASASG